MNFNTNNITKINNSNINNGANSNSSVFDSQNPIFKGNTNNDYSSKITNNYYSSPNTRKKRRKKLQIPPILASAPAHIAPSIIKSAATNSNLSVSNSNSNASHTTGTRAVAISDNQLRSSVATENSATLVTDAQPQLLSIHNNAAYTTKEPLPIIVKINVPKSKLYPDDKLFLWSPETRRIHRIWRLHPRNASRWTGAGFPHSRNATHFGVDPTSNTGFVISDR